MKMPMPQRSRQPKPLAMLPKKLLSRLALWFVGIHGNMVLDQQAQTLFSAAGAL